MQPEVEFKYHYTSDGNPVGRKHTATLGDKGISLYPRKDVHDFIPYAAVLDTTVRDHRLVIMLQPGMQFSKVTMNHLQDGQIFIFHIHKNQARDLEKFIDRKCSRIEAERYRKHLAAEGKEDQFRTVDCPHCGAVVNRSEQPSSPYHYCPFCESVFDSNRQIVTLGDNYRLCDRCGMFSRVQGYNLIYFYFLVFVYGYNWQRKHLCDTCVNPVFWRAFLGNLPFILGVPFALRMKFQSMSGRDASMKELAKANALAQKGKAAEASALYQRMQDHLLNHPGLLMNEGLAHLQAGDGNAAVQAFQRSLQACSNYEPTINIIRNLRQQQPARQNVA